MGKKPKNFPRVQTDPPKKPVGLKRNSLNGHTKWRRVRWAHYILLIIRQAGENRGQNKPRQIRQETIDPRVTEVTRESHSGLLEICAKKRPEHREVKNTPKSGNSSWKRMLRNPSPENWRKSRKPGKKEPITQHITWAKAKPANPPTYQPIRLNRGPKKSSRKLLSAIFPRP